jgi:hypothetical protein
VTIHLCSLDTTTQVLRPAASYDFTTAFARNTKLTLSDKIRKLVKADSEN